MAATDELDQIPEDMRQLQASQAASWTPLHEEDGDSEGEKLMGMERSGLGAAEKRKIKKKKEAEAKAKRMRKASQNGI